MASGRYTMWWSSLTQRNREALVDVTRLFENQPPPRASWQIPHRNPLYSLPVFGLRFLQRGYRSLCHHFVFPLALDVRRRKKILQNCFVIVVTVLLLLLISVSHSESHVDAVVGFLVRKAIQEQGVDNALCSQYFRQLPFTLSSPEVEVGIVINGTLVYRFLSTTHMLSGKVTFAEVARKRRESEAILTRTKLEERVLKNGLHQVTGGSYGAAKAYHNSIETETESIQKTRAYHINQPRQKQHSPKDDFITRASRIHVFDDVRVTSRSWEPIADDDGNLFVYSAFYDDRPSRTKLDTTRKVRVLGMSVLNELRDFPHLRKQVFCHYRWKNSPYLHISQRGKIVSIWEDHDTKYHAVFIMCELHFCGSPDYVGITVKRDVLPLSYLPVRYPVTTGQSFRHNFTTCFPVMHSHYSNKLELLQAIETDRILGADKFTLYLHSASPEVLAIIRHYVTSGVMEAVEWRLPFTDASLVHYFGQLAAINDCLYNSQYTSRYVVFHDFDELLLPRMHDTWNEMLEAIQLQEKSSKSQGEAHQYGSYAFLHVCFPTNWTHPGLPGDAVIEGSDVEVQPGDVQPFVYGFKIVRPASKKSQADAGERTAGGGSAGQAEADAKRAEQSSGPESLRGGGNGALEGGSVLMTSAFGGSTEGGRAERGGGGETNGRSPDPASSTNARRRPRKRRWSATGVAEKKVAGARTLRYRRWKSPESVPSNLAAEDRDKELTSVRYTWRENLVWAPDWRSKMLVKPPDVEMMGIHSVHMHLKGYQSKNLAAEMALVHHYRKWWVRNGTAMIHDTTAHRLATRLTANVRSVLSEVLGVQLDSEK